MVNLDRSLLRLASYIVNPQAFRPLIGPLLNRCDLVLLQCSGAAARTSPPISKKPSTCAAGSASATLTSTRSSDWRLPRYGKALRTAAQVALAAIFVIW